MSLICFCYLNFESVCRLFNVIDCFKLKFGYRILKWYLLFVKIFNKGLKKYIFFVNIIIISILNIFFDIK